MSSKFAFVPRTVSKDKNKLVQHVQPSRPVQTLAVAASHGSMTDANGGSGTKATGRKAKYSDDDYANLICIALSDYAMWSDPELRRTVDWSLALGQGQQARDGFISLSYLLQSSKILAPLQLQDSQTLVVKALRSHASDVVDVRLLVSEPSSSTWFGSRDNTGDVGGYEIRRKDWANNSSSSSGEFSKSDWSKQTIYIENIPLQYRTIPGIARFVLSLLSANDFPDGNYKTRLQDVVLPSHHQDKSGDLPMCKGFALVVLQTSADIEFLLQKWPWDRTPDVAQSKADAPADPDAVEASKFGFRTLSKMRWDELREEYLAYRQQLVEEVNAFEDAEALIHVPVTSPVASKPAEAPSSTDLPQVDDVPKIDLSSPYPPNSLVFVRNVHPETNKTTLRRLFAAAFVEPIARGMVRGDGLDYVDFNKGMESCYIRFSTPNHAQILLSHFSTNPVSQHSGLDDAGVTTDAESNVIAVELVVGKREEFYWEKVPEKIRRQAVEKGVSLTHPSSATTTGNKDADENGERGKRKRRKH